VIVFLWGFIWLKDFEKYWYDFLFFGLKMVVVCWVESW